MTANDEEINGLMAPLREELARLEEQLADRERIIDDLTHDLAANADELKAIQERAASAAKGDGG